jgi:mono/diheme cytochrome c family protein
MKRHRIVSLLAVSAALAVMNSAHAQDGLTIGKTEYLRSCAACHGAGGKGDGIVVKALIKPPPDLTKLTEANKGVFPFSRVYDAIDGRIAVIAHGTRDMPVWGDVYTREWNAGLPAGLASKEIAESMMRVRILALIEYLSTLQSK